VAFATYTINQSASADPGNHIELAVRAAADLASSGGGRGYVPSCCADAGYGETGVAHIRST
jgi:hypothetical protein